MQLTQSFSGAALDGFYLAFPKEMTALILQINDSFAFLRRKAIHLYVVLPSLFLLPVGEINTSANG